MRKKIVCNDCGKAHDSFYLHCKECGNKLYRNCYEEENKEKELI